MLTSLFIWPARYSSSCERLSGSGKSRTPSLDPSWTDARSERNCASSPNEQPVRGILDKVLSRHTGCTCANLCTEGGAAWTNQAGNPDKSRILRPTDCWPCSECSSSGRITRNWLSSTERSMARRNSSNSSLTSRGKSAIIVFSNSASHTFNSSFDQNLTTTPSQPSRGLFSFIKQTTPRGVTRGDPTAECCG